MYKIFPFLIACLFSGQLMAQSSLQVKTYTLPNGFRVWLNEDHSQSSVFGGIVVNAGAKNCPATGIAHYFEHIMFKGTEKIGTIDYQAEKIYLDSIALRYDDLACCSDELQRREIQQEINRLSIKAAEYALPNEFDNLISTYGGSGLNAMTGYDYTIYFNTFIPSYIDQWLELNSERLLHPVFRLFQSELETVYEEKNMHEDSPYEVAMQKVLERFFNPHPYQYPVIGTSEYLKNPQLSQMRKFFEDYYVASNMGLLLCGDFDSEKILPVIREKFSRIRSGKAPILPLRPPAPIQGKETEQIRIPIPLIKISALAWRGVPNHSPDAPALSIACRLLSNSGSTGYLDRLSNEGKFLAAGVDQVNFNDAGMLVAYVVPKLFFQSTRKAQQLLLNEIEKVKNEEFTLEELEQQKLELKREFETQIENLTQRAHTMMEVFSQGKDWNEYLKTPGQIDKMTRTDIATVARKYFSSDYLIFKKKTGRYPKVHIPKPGFTPVVPPHRGENSAYASRMKEEALKQPIPLSRTVDLDKDVKTVSLAPLVTLYAHTNPVNDIFTLELCYKKGRDHDAALEPMSQYLEYLGTDSLPFQDFRQKLQKLGATLSFSTTEKDFKIQLSGFDKDLEVILSLVTHFMERVQEDPKQLKKVIDNEKIEQKTLKRDPGSIQNSLFEYVAFGKNSAYFRQLSPTEIKKTGSKAFIELFKKTTKTEYNIYYVGNTPDTLLTKLLRKYLQPEQIEEKGYLPPSFPVKTYASPIVFFIDNPKATQTIVSSYTPGPEGTNYQLRDIALLFNAYFGSSQSMTSLLFQEIREFRSFAYSAGSDYLLPSPLYPHQKGYLQTYLSTQTDKTLEALNVLDSLLKEMPCKPEKLLLAKQSLRNEIHNSYPSFRKLPERVAYRKEQGFSEDPNRQLLENLNNLNMDSLLEFYNRRIKNQITCYLIIGDARRVDKEKLKQYGEIREVKAKEIFPK